MEHYLRVDRLKVSANNFKESLETRIYNHRIIEKDFRKLIQSESCDAKEIQNSVHFESSVSQINYIPILFDYFNVKSNLNSDWDLEFELGNQYHFTKVDANRMNSPKYELVFWYENKNLKSLYLEIFDVDNNFQKVIFFNTRKFLSDIKYDYFYTFDDNSTTMDLPLKLKDPSKMFLVMNDLYYPLFKNNTLPKDTSIFAN